MPRTKPISSKVNIKQTTAQDLTPNPVKYVTQRYTAVSTAAQTVINLSFAVDVAQKDAVLVIVDGKTLAEGAGNDYAFTSLLSNNTSSTITLNQALPAGLNILVILIGALVQQEPNVNSLQAQISAISTGGTNGINYIAASDAEKTIAGWTRYQNTAAATPTTGTGGTPAAATTFAQSTVTPLRGTTSFLFTKDAFNRQGEGFSYDFTIDSTDKASVLAINFDFAASANFVPSSSVSALSDVVVWLYDKDTATLIQPAPYTFAQNSGKFKSYFQTNAASTNYRLIFHVASANALAYTLAIDTVVVGPQAYSNGVPVTDLAISTTNGGATIVGATTTAPTKGVVTTDIVRVRRVGDHAHVKIEYKQSGAGSATAGSGDYLYTLPNNLSFDSNKVTFYTGGAVAALHSSSSPTMLGFATASYDDPTSPSNAFGAVVPYDATRFRIAIQYLTAKGTTASGGSFISSALYSYNLNTAAVTITADFEAPILGWSSNVQMSSDTDTRVVAMQAFKNTGSIANVITTDVINWNASPLDSSSAFNTTTGIYTVLTPGKYAIDGKIVFAQNGTGGRQHLIVKNNVIVAESTIVASLAADRATTVSHVIIDCIVGDQLKLQAFQSSGSTLAYDNTNTYVSSLSISRMSGPAQIALTESINCRYTNSAAPTMTVNADTTITGWTKDYDTHGFFNPTTGMVTPPVSGKYLLTGNLLLSTGAVSPNSQISFDFNGASNSSFANVSSSCFLSVTISMEMYLLAGQSYPVQCYQSSTTSRPLYNSGQYNHIQITRVGN